MRASRVSSIAAVALSCCVWAAGCRRGSKVGVLGGDPDRGRRTIYAVGCGACHTIDGVIGAHGLIGPPLSGIASRTIIAGRLPNTPENMLRWIMNAPGIEPGVAMPPFGGVRDSLPGSARDVVAYLNMLK